MARPGPHARGRQAEHGEPPQRGVPAPEPHAGARRGGARRRGAAAADLKKLKAQFRAWTKHYKSRLRRTKAELGSRDARRQGSCWI